MCKLRALLIVVILLIQTWPMNGRYVHVDGI